MRAHNLTKSHMLNALKRLDEIVPKTISLIIGGGGAMVLAHRFPLSTHDIDAFAKGMEFSELDPFVKQVAQELGIALDWLNPWFATFAHTLPADYPQRLIPVFSGKRLRVLALGATDLLIMKCFAHRQKDVPHAKALIRAGADIQQARRHIESLHDKRIPQAEPALDFLDDVEDQVEDQI